MSIWNAFIITITGPQRERPLPPKTNPDVEMVGFERTVRTLPKRTDPLIRVDSSYAGPREIEEVPPLEWELRRQRRVGMTFQDAQADANRALRGWRLPTIWELEALYQQKEVLGDNFDPCWFWSNTAVDGRDARLWIINFSSGCVGNSWVGFDDNHVRLVRNHNL